MHKNLKNIVILIFALATLRSLSTAQQNNDSCKERLSESINSYQPVIMPVINSDGTTLYFDRKNYVDNFGSIEDLDDIWFSKFINNVWSIPKPFAKLNTKYSDVLFSITPDESKALIYGVYQKDGTKATGFSLIDLEDVKSKPMALQIENFYNDSPNFYAHLSFDETKLLFALKRQDTQGGLDLYLSNYDAEKKNWSEPINLGTIINSKGNEGSPFLAFDNKTLYFVTDGRAGLGKSDVYFSKRLDDSWQKWSEPVNLGKPVNSQFDENSFYLSALGDFVYIVSSDTTTKRNGIYKVCMPEFARPEPYLIISGLAKKSKNSFDNNLFLSVISETENKSFSYELKKLQKRYVLILNKNNKYILTAETQNCTKITKDIDANFDKPKLITLDLNFNNCDIKTGKIFTFIYQQCEFEFGETERFKLMEFIKQNELDLSRDFKFVIKGFSSKRKSNCKEGEKFLDNQTLSIRRAERAKAMLELFGINSADIEATGLGETQDSVNDLFNQRVEIYLEKK